MKTTPPRGMFDYLPEETALRQYMETAILETYEAHGFQRITTPVLEAAENLSQSEGGENLGLIYQVMKRGAKLERALAQGAPLWDLGLRYDLTVPMARFYSAHREKLPSPFKCIQIDRAYRAERPQRGRLREFIQCDIDIVGTPSRDAEKELVLVTARAMERLGFRGVTIRMSHRQLVNDLLAACGLPPDQLPTALVALDKLDKLGAEGTLSLMREKGLDAAAVARLGEFLTGERATLARLEAFLPGNPAIGELQAILADLAALRSDSWEAVFDLSIVRGQGYYTGTVFEIFCEGYEGSVGGGGRYDGMIGRFTGSGVPAVGFSIGFERIFLILCEQGAQRPARPRLALLYTEGVEFAAAFEAAQALQAEYAVTLVPRAKSGGKQRRQLAGRGFGFLMELGGGVRPIQKENP